MDKNLIIAKQLLVIAKQLTEAAGDSQNSQKVSSWKTDVHNFCEKFLSGELTNMEEAGKFMSELYTKYEPFSFLPEDNTTLSPEWKTAYQLFTQYEEGLIDGKELASKIIFELIINGHIVK